MPIAVLGWGSLIAQPAHGPHLPLATLGVMPGLAGDGGSWDVDGPALPIELARMAFEDGVPYPSWVVTPDAERSPVLYARVRATLDEARRGLAEREDIEIADVGCWPGDSHYAEQDTIAAWCRTQGFDGVIWTALPPRWDDEDRVPTEAEVVGLLHRLEARNEASYARWYLDVTPPQIESAYRRACRGVLG